MRRISTYLQRTAPATALISVLAVAGVAWSLLQLRTPTANATGIEMTVSSKTPELPTTEYELWVTELGIKVPIILDVPGTDERAYLDALKHGVAQYAGTPKPGNPGNSFIFGHSSYFDGAEGEYNQIFERLNELSKNETFTIHHQTETYTYRVFQSAQIRDDDFTVLDQPDGEQEIVTLMTCWPPGTIAKRWVVQAERISEQSTTLN